MKFLSVLVIFCITGLISASFAQEIPAPVKAKLVSNIEAIKPGDSFKLGVLFDIDPGWHIYWKYPGETGLPTKVKFNLSNGYQAGEVMWPIPKAFKKTDGGMDFGYENSVLLWADIQGPSSIKNEDSAEIGVRISWVSCKEICIPGKTELNFSPKLGNSKSSSAEVLFQDWSDLLPITLNDSKNPFQIEVRKTDSAQGLINVELILKSSLPNKNIEFYPNPGDSLVVQNIKSIKSDDYKVTKISFEVTPQDGAVLSENLLDGLIVYSDTEGKLSAVEMKIDFNDT